MEVAVEKKKEERKERKKFVHTCYLGKKNRIFMLEKIAKRNFFFKIYGRSFFFKSHLYPQSNKKRLVSVII